MLAEARRLGVAIVLVTGQGDHRFAALADVALPRAAAGRAALRAEFDPPRRGRTEGSHSG